MMGRIGTAPAAASVFRGEVETCGVRSSSNARGRARAFSVFEPHDGAFLSTLTRGSLSHHVVVLGRSRPGPACSVGRSPAPLPVALLAVLLSGATVASVGSRVPLMHNTRATASQHWKSGEAAVKDKGELSIWKITK